MTIRETSEDEVAYQSSVMDSHASLQQWKDGHHLRELLFIDN
jgi:hypothetical protein